MMLRRRGHEGSPLMLMTGGDYDSDRHWSLHATRCGASRGSNMSRQKGLRSTTRLVSPHIACVTLKRNAKVREITTSNPTTILCHGVLGSKYTIHSSQGSVGMTNNNYSRLIRLLVNQSWINVDPISKKLLQRNRKK